MFDDGELSVRVTLLLSLAAETKVTRLAAEVPGIAVSVICSVYVPLDTLKVTGPAIPPQLRDATAFVKLVKLELPEPCGLIVYTPPAKAGHTVSAIESFAGFTSVPPFGL